MATPLKKPAVKEVSFDIRFNLQEKIDYSEMEAFFIRKLYDKYPVLQSTDDGKNLPSNFPFPVIRKRFFTKNKKQLVGIGNGILTVHTTEHSQFEDFEPKIKIMLEFLNELGLKNEIYRVGLRYIDEFKDSSEKVLYHDIASPSIEGFSEKGKNALFVMKNEDGILNLRIIESTEKPNSFVLDTDFFNEKKQMNSEEVLLWLNRAHEHLYNSFKSSINNEYFKTLQ